VRFRFIKHFATNYLKWSVSFSSHCKKGFIVVFKMHKFFELEENMSMLLLKYIMVDVMK
jgi:hypothetical protein